MQTRKYLNPRCKECSMASQVTKSLNGSTLPEEDWYWQCLAGMECECLVDGEAVTMYEDVMEGLFPFNCTTIIDIQDERLAENPISNEDLLLGASSTYDQEDIEDLEMSYGGIITTIPPMSIVEEWSRYEIGSESWGRKAIRLYLSLVTGKDLDDGDVINLTDDLKDLFYGKLTEKAMKEEVHTCVNVEDAEQ